ncbi:MAG: hypothetical protein V1827_02995 [Candidatus Micrarchaeota archaeon]
MQSHILILCLGLTVLTLGCTGTQFDANVCEDNNCPTYSVDKSFNLNEYEIFVGNMSEVRCFDCYSVLEGHRDYENFVAFDLIVENVGNETGIDICSLDFEYLVDSRGKTYWPVENFCDSCQNISEIIDCTYVNDSLAPGTTRQGKIWFTMEKDTFPKGEYNLIFIPKIYHNKTYDGILIVGKN